jgi:predicted transcriptional regulator
MSESASNQNGQMQVVKLAADIASAYVSFNTVPSAELPDLLRAIHSSLDSLSSGEDGEHEATELKPAVPVRKSVQNDYLVCLEDGKKLKMLKRYLRTRYNLSPDDYRKKWGLPPEYPMVAPSYSSQRSAFAKKIGLGRRHTGA